MAEQHSVLVFGVLLCKATLDHGHILQTAAQELTALEWAIPHAFIGMFPSNDTITKANAILKRRQAALGTK